VGASGGITEFPEMQPNGETCGNPQKHVVFFILSFNSIMAWLGRLLYSFRGHDSGLWDNDPEIQKFPATIEVTSRRTLLFPCPRVGSGTGGENLSPHLQWGNIPEGTQELVMVLQDPDAPPFSFPIMHTVVVGINPNIASFKAGELTIPKNAWRTHGHFSKQGAMNNLFLNGGIGVTSSSSPTLQNVSDTKTMTRPDINPTPSPGNRVRRSGLIEIKTMSNL